MAIADGPGSVPRPQDAWPQDAWEDEQGLLLVLVALCAREDVTPWRVDLALGLPASGTPHGASEPPGAR